MVSLWRRAVAKCGLVLALAVPSVVGAVDDHEALWKAARDGLYVQDEPLRAVAQLEGLTRKGGLDSNTLAQFYAVTGDELGAEELAFATMPRNESPPTVMLDCDEYERLPAVEALAELVADARIVMVNESHRTPLQRAFSEALAGPLRTKGFTHFGAETFDFEYMDELVLAGVPTGRTGVYTAEPAFGNLVRTVLSLGYTPFAYEQRPAQQREMADPRLAGAVREQAQAANIAQVLRRNPEARIFLHVGGGHNNKSAMGESRPMMAARLRALTGIDPVTIDQIAGTPSPARKFQSGLYRGVEQCGPVTSPMVLRREDGSFLSRHPGYDATVFFPHIDYSKGRGDWMEWLADRRLVRVRVEPHGERSVVRVHLVGDPEGASPWITVWSLLAGTTPSSA